MFRELVARLKCAPHPSNDENNDPIAPPTSTVAPRISYNVCAQVPDVEMAFITAIVDIYCGKRSLNSLGAANEARASHCLQAMPPLLPVKTEGQTTLSILRHAHLVCGYGLDGRRLYTDHEKRVAIGDFIRGDAARDDINANLGISVKSVSELVRAFAAFIGRPKDSLLILRKYAKEQPNMFKYQLSAFPPPACGRKPFLPSLENSLFKEILGQHKEHGVGLDMRECGVLYQQAVRQDGNETGDAQKQKAVCGKAFVRHNTLNRLESNTSVYPILATSPPKTTLTEGAFTKDSAISTKRAAAANPAIGIAMRRGFRAAYDEFCKTGVLPSGVDQPSPSQVYNGDEIGFDANGKHNATFGMKRGSKVRSFRLQEGEKSPFWTTLFFWSRADGTHPIPPTVVHQSSTYDKIRGDKFLHIPEPWTVHTTESGYMDQAGFLLVAS